MRRFFTAMLIGGGLVYYLNRRRGGAGSSNSWVNSGSGAAQNAADQAYGVVQETVHLQPRDNPDPDDNTLRDRVESELFADPSIPKGDINILVADRTVDVRGAVADQATIDMIVQRIEAVPDVRGVQNYLHIEGTPSPAKEEAIEASEEAAESP